MKPTVQQSKIDLHMAYHGGLIQVNTKKTKICLDCHGEGGSDVKECKDC